ncbi:VOC family protein [Amphritea sp. 1_MG-2023]|uniref:VOC family protein n=1 Tax=Amphritea sp. 1_MG-2023 TaxID=3062670 RepID=UPI0026E39AE2|nr:VOC family protein [Amphritea sp. 1_MG-2023]MDO6563454.1 VOC family protein [Amphritea sp. 1_MG-2023]
MQYQHEKLTYVELGSNALTLSKRFFSAVFDWQFSDYGPDYSAFDDQGLEGGLFQREEGAAPITGGALLIFYSHDLESTAAKITRHGGVICKAIFDFPGGRRFHFYEPGGNELAVWSDQPVV